MGRITVIGNSVVDVMAWPVTPAVFQTGSAAIRETKLTFGGDALNEAVVLSRFGKSVRLISRIGRDEAGARILSFLKDNGVSAEDMIVDPGTATSVNIVLIDEKGERYFLTDPDSSQRRLAKEDVLGKLRRPRDERPENAQPHDTRRQDAEQKEARMPQDAEQKETRMPQDAEQKETLMPQDADIVSFASIFVSTALDIPAMTEIFRRIREKPGRILAADMTKAKRGERFDDIKCFLPYIDFLFPNEAEIALLTGESDPYRNAELLNEAGVRCAVIKRGGRGCLIRTRGELYEIPACPVPACVDTTGAGDAFAAGFLWALSEGMPLKECGRFACAAASCAVEHTGATDGIRSLKKPMERYRNQFR